MRPAVGFNVATPHNAAGQRSDPVASDPCAIDTMPAATAAAGPPLEPPVDRPRSHGLRVGSNPAGSVVAPAESCGHAAFPTTERPAALEPRYQARGHRRCAARVSKGRDTDPVRGPGDLLARVFEEHRHAVAHTIEERDHNRVENGIERLDRVDHHRVELRRAHDTVAKQARLLDRAGPPQIVHIAIFSRE